MDAVVYPQSAVREIAKSFVCVRVEHDKHPDLVKQYQVKALADLRLLDADGHERDRMVGFTSVPKLVARCEAMLDRLAGREPVTVESRPAPSREVGLTPETLAQAKAKGIAYLRAEAKRGGAATSAVQGQEALVLFTWAAAGIDAGDEDAKRLTESVIGMPMFGTYQVALRALALARISDERFQEPLRDCARFLVDSQLANGQWSYRCREGDERPTLGDNSNTAYALLALMACERAGIAVPAETLAKAEKWWRESQRSDGGWGYRTDREAESYASMTESGLGSVLICCKMRKAPTTEDAALGRGLGWLAQHFSVTENQHSSYQQGRLLYHLFALERVGSLLGAKEICGHDWFSEGASFLLTSQGPDGSWDDGADMPVVNTCFALLFLVKATTFLQ
jgi:hypothetical protein